MRPGPIVVAALLVALVVFVLVRWNQRPEDASPSAPAGEADGGQRIVSIAPSVTELVYALGAGEFMVGRTIHCDYPPEARALPSVGSGTEPDVETILSLRPTVVLGAAMQSEYPAVASLEAAGVEVFLVPDQTLEDVRTAMRALGMRLGRGTTAEELVAEIDDALALAGRTAGYSTAPRVAVVVGTDPIYVAGSNTYIDPLVRIAGGSNPVSGSWVPYDDEAFIASQPDIVIMPVDDPAELAVWDRFGRSFPAVRDGRICGVERDVLSRPGPRIPEAAMAIAECISSNWPYREPEAAPTAAGGSGEGAPAGR